MRTACALAAAGAAFLALAEPIAAAPSKKPAPCAADGALQREVQAVSDRFDLTLADGTVLKIAGIDPPGPTPSDPELDLKTKAKLAASLNGRNVLYRPLARKPDRWGRVPALVFTLDRAKPFLLAEQLLDAGLARFAPAQGTSPCRAALLAAETRARSRRLGLWTDPYYAVLSPAERENFDEKAATFVLVEGEVIGIDESPFRTNLYFGPRRGYDFSVTILPRNRKLFEAAGIDVNRLKGEVLRVRGLLDLRFGPQIEVSNPDEIELVAPPRQR